MIQAIRNENTTRLENNILNGIIAEHVAINDFIQNGFSIKRTGIGSDFIATKNDFSGKMYEMYVEVKYNKSELSQKQKQKKFAMKKQGKDYFVYRVSQRFLDNFKIEFPNKVEEIKRNSTSRGMIYQDTGIFALPSKLKIILPWTCPNCKTVTVKTLPMLLQKFGLRKMKNNTIRNQSWCRKCR